MKIKTAQAQGAARSLAELVTRAGMPDLDDIERAARARAAGSELSDLSDLVRAAGIMPSRVVDVFNAFEGDQDAQSRLEARGVVDQVRTVAAEMPTDMPGLITNAGLVPGMPTGLSDGLPMVRTLATPWTQAGLPLIPDTPVGNTTGDILANSAAPTGTGGFTITDTIPDRWTIAATYGDVSRQVFDWTDDPTGRWLDQIFLDIADRAAEINIGATLVGAATTAGNVAASGADIGAALDTAEGLAGTGLQAPASYLLVNPADLPRVRRAVAPSWQLDPHPALIPTIGIAAGRVVITGPNAVTLVARPIALGAERDTERLDQTNLQAVRPKTWGVTIAVMRHFICAIRNAAGIRVVTLP